MKEPAWKNSRLVPELNPREIDAMKRRPGKDMIIFGSGTIVSQLTQHGLIDEYQLVTCPIFLGNGRPLLTGLTKNLRLGLLEAKALPSGDVMLRYARQS
jgi:dihydrofolate reductase